MFWSKVRDGLYVVTPGFVLPKHKDLRVSPAICDGGEKSYVVFTREQPWDIKARFNDAPPISIGDEALIKEARRTVRSHKWGTIKGPNYQWWLYANVAPPVKTTAWGTVYRAVVRSDLGALGWGLHDGENVLYYEFEFEFRDGVHAGFVSRDREKNLRQLAAKLRYR